jgi:hypothetical protein
MRVCLYLAGVRKTALLKEQLENVRLYNTHLLPGPQSHCMDVLMDSSEEEEEDSSETESSSEGEGGGDRDLEGTMRNEVREGASKKRRLSKSRQPIAQDLDKVNPVERQRMTRIQTLKQMKSSSTIFNIDTLNHLNELFDAIDEARSMRDLALQQSSATVTSTTNSTSMTNPAGYNTTNSGDAPGKGTSVVGGVGISSSSSSTIPLKYSLSSHNKRSRLFEIIKDILRESILPRFCVREWTCLEPSRNYPLGMLTLPYNRNRIWH